MATPLNEINYLILIQEPHLGAPSLRRVPQSFCGRDDRLLYSVADTSRLLGSVQPVRADKRDGLKTPHRGVFLTSFQILSSF